MSLINYEKSNNGYKYVLNVIDCFSKFLWSFPLTTKASKIVESHRRKIFYEFSPPEILHSDNGKEFKAGNITKLCEEFYTIPVYGRPRHPQSQGQVERLNQTIKSYLTRKLSLEKDKKWANILPQVVAEYNNEKHSTTKKSPFRN